jgi:hypothetical protein
MLVALVTALVLALVARFAFKLSPEWFARTDAGVVKGGLVVRKPLFRTRGRISFFRK